MTALLSCYFLISSASPRSYLGLLNRTATSLRLSHNPQLSPAWSTSEAVAGAGPCQRKAPAQTNSAPAEPYGGKKGSGASQRLNFNPEKCEGKVLMTTALVTRGVGDRLTGRVLLELKNPCLRLSSAISIPRSTLSNRLAPPGLDFPICLTGIAVADSPQRDQDDACTKEDKACRHSR